MPGKPVSGGEDMLPFSFEWVWDMGHILFHGGLHFALNVIGLGVAYCVVKAIYDTMKEKGSEHQ